ncbi:MAG: PD-(D/E)XK nuclease family protein [Bacteroidales bacterium]|nr:PD-(D/E)XK nuclease family protein [Bacteroidales bacterium]
MGKFMPPDSFLDRVSADLYDRYGSDISKLCLVFPSRRAGLFFAESLSKRMSRPLWQPEALSISDLIFRWAGKRPSDSLRLLTELYKAYQSLGATESPQAESFDRFYFWGEMILRDFDQIDKYLVRAKSLFQNLFDQKMLEGDYSFLSPEQVAAVQAFWSSFRPQKTELQQSFAQMWELMFPLYAGFRQSLEAGGLAYEGMLYRQVAERELVPDASVLSYVFIGFNALNTCERNIFRRLQALGLARFYWDRDDYYIADGRQEAGRFLRTNIKEFPPADEGAVYTDFTRPKEIEFWALPSEVLQTKILPQIIKDRDLHTDKRTAVVLCDESLLIPLLSALPQVAPEVNVTMGYPLAKTSLYSFTEALLMFYRSGRMRGGSCSYYHLEVFRLLSHPFISRLCPKAAEDLKNRVRKDNMLFVPVDAFAADVWLQAIAGCPQEPDSWLGFFTGLLEAVEDSLSPSEAGDPLLLPVLRLAGQELNKFRNAIQTCGLPITMPLFFNLLRQALRGITVAFSGEPLQGIQVMGILETRTLDFEHVVLLSAQEGFLPGAKEIPSFIPYNLRAGFGLPTPQDHEAIYAYYFYRLIQRAQKASLLYGSGGDGIQTGEQSRYLLQLEAESPHRITHKTLTLNVDLPVPAPEIIKEKTGMYKERLLRYMDPDSGSYLTPSALSAYVQCPLQFCFRYIEQIKEEDEVMEEADGKGLGRVLHEVMESLYRPFLGQVVTAEALERLLGAKDKIRGAVEKAILDAYAPKHSAAHLFEQGRWLILADVLAAYVEQLIRFDIAQAPFGLKAMETKLKIMFQASPHLSLPLGGRIDRIQEREGICYVVDYKTGKEQRSFASTPSLFAPERASQNGAVFQMLWYTMLYQEEHPQAKVLPSLYYIRSLFDTDASILLYDKSAKQEIKDMTPYMEDYRRLLGRCLLELFDLNRPFVQTQDREHCRYCLYGPICR